MVFSRWQFPVPVTLVSMNTFKKVLNWFEIVDLKLMLFIFKNVKQKRNKRVLFLNGKKPHKNIPCKIENKHNLINVLCKDALLCSFWMCLLWFWGISKQCSSEIKCQSHLGVIVTPPIENLVFTDTLSYSQMYLW